jgi:hypothetical protein
VASFADRAYPGSGRDLGFCFTCYCLFISEHSIWSKYSRIGFFETVFAISARKSLQGWGWTLASGLLDIVIGAYLLTYPAVTMAILPFVLGFWLLFRGFSAIGFSFDIKSYGDSNWGWFLFFAIGIIFFAL